MMSLSRRRVFADENRDEDANASDDDEVKREGRRKD
tara:strand:+ start:20354 stop:20461 length:108 start_codon:yes stop_codon:yes gene_type:complete